MAFMPTRTTAEAPPPPTSVLTLQNPKNISAELEELCVIFDKNTERGPIFVAWLLQSLRLDSCKIFSEAAQVAKEEFQLLGMGAVLNEEAFQLPVQCISLAGAVVTFHAEHQQQAPVEVLDLLLVGGLSAMLELFLRTREALEEKHLEEAEMVFSLAIYTLLHFAQHRGASDALEDFEGCARDVIEDLFDALSDSNPDIIAKTTQLIVLLLFLFPRKAIYAGLREHANANTFGTQLVSLINRGSFRTLSQHDVHADLLFLQFLLSAERDMASAPCAIIYASDVGVLAEVLERELSNSEGECHRMYLQLLKDISTHPLRPVDNCSVNLAKYSAV